MLVEDTAPRQGIEPFRQRVPRHVVVNIELLLLVLGPHRVVQRSHGFAFAENLQRHSLAEVALRAAVHKQTPLRAHQVEETGRDHLAVDIAFGGAAGSAEIAHLGNRVAVDGHTAGHARSAAAVADAPISQNHVVLRRASARGKKNR